MTEVLETNKEIFNNLVEEFDLDRKVTKYKGVKFEGGIYHTVQEISEMHRHEVATVLLEFQEQFHVEEKYSKKELRSWGINIIKRHLLDLINAELKQWYVDMSIAKQKAPKTEEMKQMFERLYKSVRNQKATEFLSALKHP